MIRRHNKSNQALEPTADRCESPRLILRNSSRCLPHSPQPAVAQLRLVRPIVHLK